MNDAQLCRLIAETWVEHDGDANGFLACQRQIVEAIKDVNEKINNWYSLEKKGEE